MTNNNKLAIIGGSQGFRTVQGELIAETLGAIDTPYGRSQPVHLLNSGILFLSRHGDAGYHVTAPYVNYRANIYALKELGVERIVAWSGPGAIDPGIPIGDLLVPGDLIDETRGRASTFYEGLGIGFIRQNPVFCPDLALSLATAIEARQGHCRSEDVYVCTQGPRLETKAEIRKFASYGGTLVGMTLVPEAFLARELEMCYCPVCYVTNYAEGVVERPYQPGVLFEGMMTEDEKSRVDAAAAMLPGIAVEALTSTRADRPCPCSRSMERYRTRGDIGDDWHTWIAVP
jgi:5'-methylthioadenosine phosphorylase